MKLFLTAEWRHLINLTYKVPPKLLLPHVPQGLELDVIDGSAYVSLVAFDFLNTRVRGVKVPFHINFPEVNLRYYVKHKGRRGVVFIKEYVPKHCIAFIANRFYNEPYTSFPMESKQENLADGGHRSTYRIWKERDKYKLEVQVSPETFVPSDDTPDHYFKEHSVGFGKEKKGDTLYYLVEHPVWATRKVTDLNLDYDFGALYGPEWEFLNTSEPVHRIFAEGSNIRVYRPNRLEGAELPQMEMDE
ncbi:MAG: DUF2071 domain-containing protein [Bacteroidota bacterium]